MRAKALFSAAIVISMLAFSSAETAEDRLDGLSPPIRKVKVLVDTRVEDPPVYSGATALPLPTQGETVELQVFLPDAAGRKAFGYILEFDNTGGRFTDNFTIKSARIWKVVPVLDSQGRPTGYAWSASDMNAPLNSDGPGRSALFAVPLTVPANGLIASLSLEARRNVDRAAPLRLNVSVAVFSITPPTRLWHLRAQQVIPWK